MWRVNSHPDPTYCIAGLVAHPGVKNHLFGFRLHLHPVFGFPKSTNGVHKQLTDVIKRLMDAAFGRQADMNKHEVSSQPHEDSQTSNRILTEDEDEEETGGR